MVTEKSTEKNLVKKRDNKFEFALFINDYKVIGRYFDADGYSPLVRNSVDIRDTVDDIVAMLQEVLKRRDLEVIYEGYDLTQRSGKTRTKTK